VREGDVVISSTEIRQLIAAGRVREAAEMLGRYHEVRGVVIRGDQRGRELGFPTANLDVSAHCAVPGGGVYAAYASISGTSYPAVANIGTRPTFGHSEPTLEVHVLGLDQDIYGQEIIVQFVERLRAERRFGSRQALSAQITEDIARAREILQ